MRNRQRARTRFAAANSPSPAPPHPKGTRLKIEASGGRSDKHEPRRP